MHDIRRFTQPWEAHASRLLRRRDPAALAEYAMRERIHGGTADDIERDLFDAWRADALSTDAGGRRSVLMIVTTNQQAAVLSERARNALLQAGAVSDGPTARLRDNLASVGDHLVTRRNDRRLRTSGRGWVVNGDVGPSSPCTPTAQWTPDVTATAPRSRCPPTTSPRTPTSRMPRPRTGLKA